MEADGNGEIAQSYDEAMHLNNVTEKNAAGPRTRSVTRTMTEILNESTKLAMEVKIAADMKKMEVSGMGDDLVASLNETGAQSGPGTYEDAADEEPRLQESSPEKTMDMTDALPEPTMEDAADRSSTGFGRESTSIAAAETPDADKLIQEKNMDTIGFPAEKTKEDASVSSIALTGPGCGKPASAADIPQPETVMQRAAAYFATVDKPARAKKRFILEPRLTASEMAARNQRMKDLLERSNASPGSPGTGTVPVTERKTTIPVVVGTKRRSPDPKPGSEAVPEKRSGNRSPRNDVPPLVASQFFNTASTTTTATSSSSSSQPASTATETSATPEDELLMLLQKKDEFDLV